MKWKLIFPLSLFMVLGVGCTKEEWKGFYYPSGCLICEENYIFSPPFSSLEECRDWADSTKEELGNNPNDEYECGLNCKFRDGFNVCKESVK